MHVNGKCDFQSRIPDFVNYVPGERRKLTESAEKLC
jgi:hypothetical protein